jgi:hypothetical protein
LLDWLAAHELTLATARQGGLDTWLPSEKATHRVEAGNFVRWATSTPPTTKYGFGWAIIAAASGA